MIVILTCEHASNFVPAGFRGLFEGAEATLASHRGWDPGSHEMGLIFKKKLTAPLFVAPATRLLVEPNRSSNHPNLFSAFTNSFDGETKRAILAEYYYPHRMTVENWIVETISKGETALHLSLHTFVPELDGHIRNADVGLLYDPQRKSEKQFCNRWRASIMKQRSDLKIRRNYPYLGSADGFTTYLRRKFSDDRYLGIELEINQRWLESSAAWRKLAEDLSSALDFA